MSGDDIVFDEMKVREPERLRRPDRDRKYACLAYEVPAPIDLPIFLDRQTADAIERHALSDTSVELGGILLGKECLDVDTGEPFVWITRSLEAKHYANTQASFTYTHDSWEEITRERDRLCPDCDIVGWYHTHPSFGIFLSHHDLFIHQHFFAQPLQVAYVVDPINQSRGFFQWRDGGLAQVGGYFLTGDRGERLALSRLVNELEKLPGPEGGGGGTISPRLEAELIKMLNRPAPAVGGSPVEKLQLAALFGMLGTLIGVAAIALALWLYQLQARLQDQNDSMLALARVVEQVDEGQHLALDALRAKMHDDDPDEFLERYKTVAHERDEARRQLEVQRSLVEGLGTQRLELGQRASRAESELKDARADLEQLKKDAKDAPRLRERVAALEETNADQKQRLEDAAPLLKSEPGEALAELRGRLARYQFIAYAGWGLAVALGLALAGFFLYSRPPDETEFGEQARDEERPTHRIV